jgi:hypothetical protein
MNMLFASMVLKRSSLKLSDRTIKPIARKRKIATAQAEEAGENSNLAAGKADEEAADTKEVKRSTQTTFLMTNIWPCPTPKETLFITNENKKRLLKLVEMGGAPVSSIAVHQQDSQSVITTPPSGATAPATGANSSFIRNMLSNSSATRSTAGTTATNDIVLNGKVYRCDNHRMQYNHRPDSMLHVLVRFVWTIFDWFLQLLHCNRLHLCSVQNMKYYLHNYIVTDNPGSLIDRGANGGFGGANVLVIEYTGTFADVTGLADHTVTDIPIATCAGKLNTTTGPIICILSQIAYHGEGKTVHSCAQMEAYGLKICDRSRKIGGDQRILTPEGYVIPLAIRDGLAYMDMTKPNADDMNLYPHVIFTSDMPWDPRVLDDEYDIDGSDAPVLPEGHAFVDPRVNDYGEILSRQAQVQIFDHSERDLDHGNSPEDYVYLPGLERLDSFEDNVFHDGPPGHDLEYDTLLAAHVESCIMHVRYVHATGIKIKTPDLEVLRPHFGWLPTGRIHDTLGATTQFYRAEARLPFRKRYKTRFPAANVSRLNEVVATDTMFADEPAHDDGIMGHGGATMCQIYCGKESQITSYLRTHIRRHLRVLFP